MLLLLSFIKSYLLVQMRSIFYKSHFELPSIQDLVSDPSETNDLFVLIRPHRSLVQPQCQVVDIKIAFVQ